MTKIDHQRITQNKIGMKDMTI